MSLKALDAASAYAAALGKTNVAQAGTGKSAKEALGGADSFAAVLKDAVGSVSDAVDRSQKASISTMNGQMDLIDVVNEVNNAQMVVETVVAVRDRVIQAYQDIIKMPI
ncbi:MAG: flagellar hook-basal body complex protein FliE [Alphaproteobacteria bacterium]|nr:MAG: flagellar hook-basal body complex protein FliE [Alphaproteobacteria bacterium]